MVCLCEQWLLCFSNQFISTLWITCSRNPLFLAIVSMVFHSRCLACSVIGGVIILFI